MTDRRLVASNGRVAHVALRGTVQADRFVNPERFQVSVPITSLRSHPAPDAPRDRELAFGEEFDVLGMETHGWAFGVARRDGYVGYVRSGCLSVQTRAPTHRVISNSYLRSEPRLKATDKPEFLPLGARVHVRATHHDHCEWAEIDRPSDSAYIPAQHLADLSIPATDPVTEAERYLGVPYLWAGNSGFGTDCSGLVQAALLACHIPCPGDSDLQAQAFPSATNGYRRGDLLFWKGHVAMITAPNQLIHANAHHMKVACEPIDQTISRIKTQGGGPVTAHTRPREGETR